jgi:HTH-type transcriptional regulator, cell division transcriptional repressor
MTGEHDAAAAAAPDNWYSEENATFGDRLAGAREALGLSQHDLAERIGVRTKTVQQWEDDVKEPRANRLQMLAGMLNVSLMWLLTGEGYGVAAPDVRPAHSDETEALMQELREMRNQMGALAEQLGRVEARLRLSMAREAA